MKSQQQVWRRDQGWATNQLPQTSQVQTVFLFGSRELLLNQEPLKQLRETYPQAVFIGCSTAGEISGSEVLEDSLIATAVQFEHTPIKTGVVYVNSPEDSFDAGKRLGQSLEKHDLTHVVVFSAGLNVNGTTLIKGLTSQLPERVSVTGGLAGDGAKFESTTVMCGEVVADNAVAALCLYGNRIRVGYGSMGGWDSFGPERLVTRSSGNVLYELDNKSALELYKNYLGDHASDLPSSGLLFPLSLRANDGTEGLVRTILSVNEAEQSMTFAGDIPEGAYVRLMKANFDRLIDGAISAGNICHETIGKSSPDLALLISCVGRKLVLRQRVEEEVEGVREVLGDDTVTMGFYSYGEISPLLSTAKCELHNQTMTITTFSESHN